MLAETMQMFHEKFQSSKTSSSASAVAIYIFFSPNYIEMMLHPYNIVHLPKQNKCQDF